MKRIEISEKAWERLETQKREGESPSETILRLIRDQLFMDGFGAMSDVEGFEKSVKNTREELDNDLKGRSSR
ncbi:hypothetical protein HTSR_0838 [Halodesulfurarchaeum formicicum]|uniref:CopG family transcriptional regulator n=1 Tax=Halodesulfurarchaeum formicicum TaxID=1873524 RepID=A0A1D8S3V4_9EURY|nr:antitoxin VapB family protein [Halodesulfurarchaeum formicicum]AOW80024.1 hypothetical protein HTSR_0838 [Halodesulfurarchaeum formicicum]APE95318.1 hypothetical protein HSR6_0865 [Halodesulfurarchaeum formicicum]